MTDDRPEAGRPAGAPADVQHLAAIAAELLLRRDFPRALQYALKVIGAAPDDARGYALAAHVHACREEPSQALGYAQSAFALDPECARAHQAAAMAWLVRRKPRRMRGHVATLLRLDPDCDIALRIDAAAQRLRGRFGAARRSLAQATALAPQNPANFTELARVEIEARRWRAAERALESALRLDAERCDGRYLAGYLAWLCGRRDQLARHLDFLRANDPTGIQAALLAHFAGKRLWWSSRLRIAIERRTEDRPVLRAAAWCFWLPTIGLVGLLAPGLVGLVILRRVISRVGFAKRLRRLRRPRSIALRRDF